MHLSLYQFKHYSNQTLEISENLQIVVGNNGSGKSTLCEAVSILVNASNPHHTSWEEKSSFGQSEWALRLELGEILFQSIFGGCRIVHQNGIWMSHRVQNQNMKTRCRIERFGYKVIICASSQANQVSGEISSMTCSHLPVLDMRKSCETIVQRSPHAIVWFSLFSREKREKRTSHPGIRSSQNMLCRSSENEEHSSHGSRHNLSIISTSQVL